MSTVTILGATGSIGTNTLSVISQNIDQYQVFALSAQSNVSSMLNLCKEWQPRYAVMADIAAAEALSLLISAQGLSTTVLAGEEGLITVSQHPECEIVVAGIVGAAGLAPTLAAARAGKRILLANKEVLVMAGALFMKAVEEGGATLIPVDSEHNALWQAMPPGYRAGQIPEGVEKLILTASGGPFRETPLTDLAHITPAQAIKHPNWSMGPKISVDSATMMNKGLEIIEAHWLFAMPTHQIEVVIHPESIIHSLVEYRDGSQVAQLGMPDMRTPIACSLSWPKRIYSGAPKCNLTQIGRLHFYAPDPVRFPCLSLALQSIEAGGAASAILNAANEVTVASFSEQIRYMDIPKILESVLTKFGSTEATSLKDLIQIDQEARKLAKQFCHI